MRKIKIVLYLVICFGNISASGQITRETGSINELLRSVETHNTELKAFSQRMQAQKTENKLSNNLPDPTVSYSHLWGADNSSETIGELIVSQSMDFPTLYHTRRQLNRQKNAMADHEYQLKRREILLKAQEICFDIILLRKEQLLLKERHQNASELATLYQQRIESGDANVIELNKVKLELLNAKTEASINETNLKKKEEELKNLEAQLQDALQYSVANKEIYDNLKAGINQEATIKNKIEQTKIQIDNILKREELYKNDVETFVKDLEPNVCLPKLIEVIKPEVNLILKITKQKEQQLSSNLSPEQIEAISEIILRYLKQNNLTIKDIQLSDLVDFVISDSKNAISNTEYDFLDFSEIRALDTLLGQKYANPFPVINQQQIELNLSIKQIPVLEAQIEQMKAQITGRDYTLLKAYEENEANIKRIERNIDEIGVEISKIDKRLHQFDVQTNQEPDPKYEALGKLKPFFDDVANKLLKSKKLQIELKM